MNRKQILVIVIIALCLAEGALAARRRRTKTYPKKYNNYPRNNDNDYPRNDDDNNDYPRDNDDDNNDYPTNPTNPTNPTEPEDPTEPTEPTNPTEPEDPTEPTDPTTPTDPNLSDFASRCIASHNAARQAVGIAGLTWSDSLASGAQSYAVTLSKLGNGSLKHSGGNYGENLASGVNYNVERLIQLWTNEKQYFKPGCTYPNCSTGGVVGHYTAMVWRTTTQVGCGLAGDGKWNYLVCRYLKGGNISGQKVY